MCAVGEAVGGVHGDNRLGGSGTLECLVSALRASNFIGNSKMLRMQRAPARSVAARRATQTVRPPPPVSSPSASRCTVTVHGKTYDLTDWAPKHSGGSKCIFALEDTEATAVFDQNHSNKNLLKAIGHLEIPSTYGTGKTQPVPLQGRPDLGHPHPRFRNLF